MPTWRCCATTSQPSTDWPDPPMYPDSFLWWLGGMAVVLGLVGCLALLAMAVDNWYQRHIEKRHGAPGDDDDGRTRIAVALLGATFALVVGGIALYEAGEVGWAQFGFILASGTAGAGCVAALDRGHDG